MLGHSHRHRWGGLLNLIMNIGWVQALGAVLGQDNSTGVCRCGWMSMEEWEDAQRLSSQVTSKNKIMPFVVKRNGRVTRVNHNMTWWAKEEVVEKENITDNRSQEVKRSHSPPHVFLWIDNKPTCNPTFYPADAAAASVCCQKQPSLQEPLSHSAHQMQQRMRHYVYRSCGSDVGKSVPLKRNTNI